MLVLRDPRVALISSTQEPSSAPFQPFWISSTKTDKNNPCFRWTKRHSQFGTFCHPNGTSSNCLSRRPASGCPCKFRSRGTTGSSIFNHDLAIRVVDDVSIFLDILTLECWAPLERPPFWLGCKQTLRRWLVLHNQVVSQRRPLLLLPPLCEADDPCSVNTACAPESSFHNVTSEHDSSFVFFDALVLTPQSWGDRSPSM